ncbi:MAG: PilN domain-containing protein [Candidatus Omnitrophota bacterium]|nr:PilN domain-containing protein [Candidatus Omnitrophota bacterium]
MIEINLLPEGLRKKKTELSFNLNIEAEKLKFLIVGGAIGILIFIIIALSLGSFIMDAQIKKLLARENNFSGKISHIDSVNKEIAVLKSKMTALDQLTKRKFLWTEKLNQLSDLILPGIWFTHIYTDNENRLIIEGSVVSKSEEAMAFVGKFMKNLKDDQVFFKDFSNIKLESVQRRNKEERDIVEFKIALYFQ